MSEQKTKILSAIVLLVIITGILKAFEYFGYDLEPDRTRDYKYQLEKEKQLQSDQQIDTIIKEVIK